MSRPRRSWLRTVAVSLAVTLGSAVGTAWGAFSATTSNGVNSFSAAADTTAPTISRVVAAKTSGANPGTIRQGGDYYVYAQVTDDVSVATVTANTSSFDSGVTAAGLSTTGGPWTVGGLSYNYRSAVLTADTPLNTGSSYSYTVSATDGAGNPASPFAASVTIETYNSVISSTSGILGHWRLGDGAISADDFTDSAGTVLTSHTGELEATWTRHSSSTAGTDGVISDENRVRRNNTDAAMYYTSGVPPSADYFVEADIHVKSLLSSDAIGLIGRASTSADTYYLARYVTGGANRWDLAKVVSGTSTFLGSYSQTLSSGSTYRLRLEMSGSTIRLLVDGVQRVSVSDTSISATGRGGARLGYGGATSIPSNTSGFHLDDFRVTSLTTTAVDGPGTNNGTYTNGVRLNQPDALAGDTNRSVLFDGVDDYVPIARQISDDFSIEFWFRSTQGIGTGTHWWSGAGLVDAEVGGTTNDFGVSLRSDGKVVAGVGNPDTSIRSTASGFNDGGWHHVVFTRTRSSGALALYVDGQSQGSATGPTQALTATANINFGRIQTATNYYSGSLDEVAIYNSVLSSSIVLDHYKAGTGTG